MKGIFQQGVIIIGIECAVCNESLVRERWMGTKEIGEDRFQRRRVSQLFVGIRIG